MEFVKKSGSVTDISIPEGNVIRITDKQTGDILWEKKRKDIYADPPVTERYPLYVIGTKAETRSSGAEANSDGWRMCGIPEGYRIINLAEGFIIKTEAGTYVCGNIDITYAQAYRLQTELNLYTVPTLKEEYADLVRAVNGMCYSANNINRIYEHYFFWLDKYGKLSTAFTATDGYGANFPKGHGVSFNGDSSSHFLTKPDYLIFPEQSGAAKLYEKNSRLDMYVKYSNFMLRWNNANLASINIKKILETFQGTRYKDYSRIILTEDGKIIQALTTIITSPPINEIKTGINNIKNIWSDNNSSFIQDESNNLYVCGSFGNSTYSEFTYIGNYDIKKLLQAGSATVILTNRGELYYQGQCASIPAMATQVNEFTQIYPRYIFHDVHLESTDMAALIKHVQPSTPSEPIPEENLYPYLFIKITKQNGEVYYSHSHGWKQNKFVPEIFYYEHIDNGKVVNGGYMQTTANSWESKITGSYPNLNIDFEVVPNFKPLLEVGDTLTALYTMGNPYLGGEKTAQEVPDAQWIFNPLTVRTEGVSSKGEYICLDTSTIYSGPNVWLKYVAPEGFIELSSYTGSTVTVTAIKDPSIYVASVAAFDAASGTRYPVENCPYLKGEIGLRIASDSLEYIPDGVNDEYEIENASKGQKQPMTLIQFYTHR